MRAVNRLADWTLSLVAPRGKARAGGLPPGGCGSEYKCNGVYLYTRWCCCSSDGSGYVCDVWQYVGKGC